MGSTRRINHAEPVVSADGGHCERSPLAHLHALQELLEIRSLLQLGGLPPAPILTDAIDRLALGLGSLRHLDGGLALFNGSREELPGLIDFVLSQTRRPGASSATRRCISSAALFVNVRARICDGATPLSMRWAMRWADCL